MRQDERAIHMYLVPEMNILAENAHALDARPPPDRRAPAADGVDHCGVGADGDPFEEDAAHQPRAALEHTPSTDRHIGTNAAASADRRARVYLYIPYECRAARYLLWWGHDGGRALVVCMAESPQVRHLLPVRWRTRQLLEEEGVALKKVPRLLDVHPIA